MLRSRVDRCTRGCVVHPPAGGAGLHLASSSSRVRGAARTRCHPARTRRVAWRASVGERPVIVENNRRESATAGMTCAGRSATGAAHRAAAGLMRVARGTWEEAPSRGGVRGEGVLAAHKTPKTAWASGSGTRQVALSQRAQGRQCITVTAPFGHGRALTSPCPVHDRPERSPTKFSAVRPRS